MNRELLKIVSNTPGIPGYEDAIQAVVREYLDKVCDEVSSDRVGNVIGIKRAANPPTNGDRPLRVILAAHADEIGMMVKHIDSDGFISFQPVGGLNPQVIVSQRVIIHGRDKIKGVIVPRRNSPAPALEEILIDVGLSREAVCDSIVVGDIVTFAQELVELNDKVYMGRNFDNRIGTYCLLDTMAQLDSASVDVYAVSTVQEEVGVRGMPMAAYSIEPDIGLALDGSLTWGAHIPKHEHLCALGEGTGIYIMDRLTVGDRRLVQFLFDLCEGGPDAVLHRGCPRPLADAGRARWLSGNTCTGRLQPNSLDAVARPARTRSGPPGATVRTSSGYFRRSMPLSSEPPGIRGKIYTGKFCGNISSPPCSKKSADADAVEPASNPCDMHLMHSRVTCGESSAPGTPQHT